MEKHIENEPYYHGLLPREDMKTMLKQNGDFLLRMSEPQAGERAIILSMMVREEKGDKGVSIFLIFDVNKLNVSDETLRYPQNGREVLR